MGIGNLIAGVVMLNKEKKKKKKKKNSKGKSMWLAWKDVNGFNVPL